MEFSRLCFILTVRGGCYFVKHQGEQVIFMASGRQKPSFNAKNALSHFRFWKYAPERSESTFQFWKYDFERSEPIFQFWKSKSTKFEAFAQIRTLTGVTDANECLIYLPGANK